MLIVKRNTDNATDHTREVTINVGTEKEPVEFSAVIRPDTNADYQAQLQACGLNSHALATAYGLGTEGFAVSPALVRALSSADRAFQRAFVETIMVSWDGIEGPDGTALELTADNAYAVFDQYPQALAELRKAAMLFSVDEAVERDKVVGK